MEDRKEHTKSTSQAFTCGTACDDSGVIRISTSVSSYPSMSVSSGPSTSTSTSTSTGGGGTSTDPVPAKCGTPMTAAEVQEEGAIFDTCMAKVGNAPWRTAAAGAYGNPDANGQRDLAEAENADDKACQQGAQRMVSLGGEMLRRTGNLPEYQRACVAQCVTNYYLTYGNSWGSGGSASGVVTRHGGCGWFANFEADLMQSAGLNAHATGGIMDDGIGHAWDEIVFADGRRVWQEPQNPVEADGCTFLQ